jgi:hypothetical protein
MNIRLILFFAVVIVGGCMGQKTPDASGSIGGRIDLKTVLSWLPPDTETLQVANGPFWMSNFEVGGQDDKDHEITVDELEKQFEGLTLGLFNSAKGLLGKHLDGKKVLLALEGSRHFRPPAGLGELPFEGSGVAIFVSATRTPSCKDSRRNAMLRHDQALKEGLDEVAKGGFRAVT